MKKSFYTIITLALLISLLIPIFSSNYAEAQSFKQTSTSNSVKPWTITFNEAVAGDRDNLNQIYVQSDDNNKVEISINLSADSKEVIVIPQNHYNFAETYTLVIPKGFKSAGGQKLPEDTKMPFIIEGQYIEEITANFNALATNITVKGADSIAEVKVTINNGQTETLISNGTHFSKGLLGLVKGDRLKIQVYNEDRHLLETHYYNVH
ncbi:Ig-like domain-containing protein [Solibacillus sp. FSL W7-1464]|uniref:Ig-like domain-containing protein n=1 Tax=Solibacillus sp. FSL W7-1464 TaxID=2921706 RepID=UPI0030FA3305